MSALDGETLTLPSGLSSMAGFGRSDNPYSDSPNSDMEMAAIMASNQQREEEAQQNVLSPESPTQVPYQQRSTSTRVATLQMPPPAAAAPPPLVTPQDKTQPARNTSAEAGWRENPNSFDYNPNASSSAPHPLLNDSRFWQAWRQDPKAAQKLYRGVTGRALDSDLQLYAAGQKTLQEEDKVQVTDMLKKGLTFHPVTGEPMMEKPLKGAVSMPGVPPPTYKQSLEPYEKAALARSYKPLTGLDLPTGISTPRFSTPEEATLFTQTVKTYFDNDKSNDPDAVKIERAKTKVQSSIWNAQQTAAGVASNSAAVNSNDPGTLSRFLAKTINLGNTVGRMSGFGSHPPVTPENVSGAGKSIWNWGTRPRAGLPLIKNAPSVSDILYQMTGGNNTPQPTPTPSKPLAQNDFNYPEYGQGTRDEMMLPEAVNPEMQGRKLYLPTMMSGYNLDSYGLV